MHQTLHKRITILFMGILILVAACMPQNKHDSYTNYMWLEDVCELSGFICEDNIDKTLEDYGVIKEGYNHDESLKREFMAYTLSNLLGENNHLYNSVINDIDDSKYRDEILNFVSYSYININDQMFHPKKEVSKDEALEYLKMAVDYINNRDYENVSNLEFSEEIIYLDENSEYQSGDVIYDGENLYRVMDGLYEMVDLEDILNDSYISGSEMIDFDSAYIEEIHQTYQNSSIYEDDEFERQSSQSGVKTFEINGYKVSYSAALNRLHLHISKKNDHGINFYFDSDIYDIKPSYKWNYKNSKLQEGYLRLGFKTSEETGMSIGSYQYLYGDFSELDKTNLFETAKNFLKEKEDMVDTSFSICRIHVPVGNIPTLEILLELKVNIYVSGKVELLLTSTHNLGFEYRNGTMRIINDSNKDIDFNLEASTSCKTNLDISLKALNKRIMNVDAEAGIKAKMDTIVHMYDDDLHISENSSAPYDILNALLNENGEVMACGDLSLYWVANLTFNEADTMAYRLGLYRKINILDEDNQIFNNRHHIENGMFVDKCTRDIPFTLKSDEIELNTDKIILESYSMVIKNKEETVVILSIPDGYTLEDLRFESSDNNILKVTDNGVINAIKPGVSKIRVYTNDDKYESYINCLVSDAAFEN